MTGEAGINELHAVFGQADEPEIVTSSHTPWSLDTLLDAVVPDMHREQVLALVQEAYDTGHREAAEDDDLWKVAANAWAEQRARLTADLARALQVVKAAEAWRDRHGRALDNGQAAGWFSQTRDLFAAVDRWREHQTGEVSRS